MPGARLTCKQYGFNGRPVAFNPVWRGQPDPHRPICLHCAAGGARRNPSPWIHPAAILIFALAGSAFIAMAHEHEGWFSIGFACYLALLLPVIALHEAGHWIAARIVGMDVLKVSVGSGSTLWSGRIFGVPVTLGALPRGGVTDAGTETRRSIRLRRKREKYSSS